MNKKGSSAQWLSSSKSFPAEIIGLISRDLSIRQLYAMSLVCKLFQMEAEPFLYRCLTFRPLQLDTLALFASRIQTDARKAAMTKELALPLYLMAPPQEPSEALDIETDLKRCLAICATSLVNLRKLQIYQFEQKDEEMNDARVRSDNLPRVSLSPSHRSDMDKFHVKLGALQSACFRLDTLQFFCAADVWMADEIAFLHEQSGIKTLDTYLADGHIYSLVPQPGLLRESWNVLPELSTANLGDLLWLNALDTRNLSRLSLSFQRFPELRAFTPRLGPVSLEHLRLNCSIDRRCCNAFKGALAGDWVSHVRSLTIYVTIAETLVHPQEHKLVSEIFEAVVKLPRITDLVLVFYHSGDVGQDSMARILFAHPRLQSVTYCSRLSGFRGPWTMLRVAENGEIIIDLHVNGEADEFWRTLPP